MHPLPGAVPVEALGGLGRVAAGQCHGQDNGYGGKHRRSSHAVAMMSRVDGCLRCLHDATRGFKRQPVA